MAIASASESVAGTDCCAPATAGPSRSPALSSTYLMGILEDGGREVEAHTRIGRSGFRPATGAARLTGNLTPRSPGWHPVRRQAARGYLHLHQTPCGVEPEVDDGVGAARDGDVVQRGRVAVQGGGLETLVLDLDALAAQAARDDRGERAGRGGGPPRGEHVEGEDGVVE